MLTPAGGSAHKNLLVGFFCSVLAGLNVSCKGPEKYADEICEVDLFIKFDKQAYKKETYKDYKNDQKEGHAKCQSPYIHSLY